MILRSLSYIAPRVGFTWVFAALVVASPANAQMVGVTFQANDEDLEVSGTLRDITDEGYVIETSAGEITLKATDVTCVSKACPVMGPNPPQQVPAHLRRIALSSLDKRIKIEGALLGVSDQRFLVDVAGVGLVSFARRGVRCSGPACLVTAAMVEQIAPAQVAAPAAPVVTDAPKAPPLQIVGTYDLTNGVLASVLKEYAGQGSGDAQLRKLSQSTYVMPAGDDLGTFFVGGTGPSVAFGALAAGAADIVVTNRPPNPSEMALLERAGIADLRGSPNEVVLGEDTLVVVTHPSLKIDQLMPSELAQIYQGEIENWAQLGGPDQPIAPLTHEHGSTQNAVFNQSVFGATTVRFERGVIAARSTTEMKAILEAEPFGIGYVPRSQSGGLNIVDVKGGCGGTGAHDEFAIKAGETLMPLKHYLYANPTALEAQGSSLLRFAANLQGQDGLAQDGIVGAKIARLAQGTRGASIAADGLETDEGLRLSQELKAYLETWERVSTTFRGFEASSLGEGVQLDRLSAYLVSLPLGSEVTAVGFHAAAETFEAALSNSRAQSALVAQQLSAKAAELGSEMDIGSVGFGALLPVFCEAEIGGGALNTRVEIWVRTP